jgi:hypothetical protein
MHMVQQGKEMGSDPNSCLPINDFNNLFLELAPKCPMLMFKWCYLLTLVNFSDQAFWARILHTQPHDFILEQGYYKAIFFLSCNHASLLNFIYSFTSIMTIDSVLFIYNQILLITSDTAL